MWKRKRKLEAESGGSGKFFVEAEPEALWWKRLEAEANSKTKVLKRSRKRKQFFQNQALPDFQPGYNRWAIMLQ